MRVIGFISTVFIFLFITFAFCFGIYYMLLPKIVEALTKFHFGFVY